MTAKFIKYVLLETELNFIETEIEKYEYSLTSEKKINILYNKKQLLLNKQMKLMDSFKQKDIDSYENYYQSSFFG